MSKVDIILLSFNRPEMLPNAVDSVLGQTNSDWRLFIADFSSSPMKKEAIKKYYAELTSAKELKEKIQFVDFPCLTQEENEHSTPYATKINETFKLTTAPYIAYLIDDDLWKTTHIARCLSTFEKNPGAEVVYSGLVTVDKRGEKDRIVNLLPSVLIRRDMFASVDHITVMHTRNVMDATGGWDTDERVRQYGDAAFFTKIAKANFLAYPTGYITAIKILHGKNLNLTGSHYEQ